MNMFFNHQRKSSNGAAPREWPHYRLPVVPAHRSGANWFNLSQNEIDERYVPKIDSVNVRARNYNVCLRHPEILDPSLK